MALPVAPPPVNLFNERVDAYQLDLKHLVDDVANGFFLNDNVANSVKAFDDLVKELEMLNYDDGSDFRTRFVQRSGSPVSKMRQHVFNRPLLHDVRTILQHAVVSAFRENNNFRNAGALEIINRLLDNRSVDPRKLSPENMDDDVVEGIPEQDGVAASDVVAWIRSQRFMASVALVLRPRWRDLASKIETKLHGTGGDM